jgi:hypothetical protein
MTRNATTSRQVVVGPARGRARSAREIEDAVGSVVRSDEPAVVLSSLARASSPVRTADLEGLLESGAAGRARREHLHVAASHGQTAVSHPGA